MKIYISNYRDHWISPYTILNTVFRWKSNYDAYEKEPPVWLTNTSNCINRVLDTIHPQITYIKLDEYDTWNMDSTLSVIILPMLIQLKKTKHGAPRTNDSDVPDHLKSYNAPKPTTEWDVDLFHFDRWNYILDEMIFAFGSSTCDDWKDQYQSGESDFQFIDIGDGVGEMIEGPNHTLVYDWDGLHSHTNRIKNGFRLFGTYYQNLWD